MQRLVGWFECTVTRTQHCVLAAKRLLVTTSIMPRKAPIVATSDIVALQTAALVVVSLLLSVQEAVVVVVHVFGFSHAS